MASVRAKSKATAAGRWRLPEHVGVIVGERNRVLRGKGNSARQFSWIDQYVRVRLALSDSRKRAKHGRCRGRCMPGPGVPGWASCPLRDGPLQPRCDSDRMNTVGEP